MRALIVLLLVVILLFVWATREVGHQRDAYQKISQQFGVVMVNAEDGKRFVSFAFRAQQRPALPESPEFLAALAAIKDLPDVRGVHLDSLAVTEESLRRLDGLSTLERLTVHNTGIGEDQALAYHARHPAVWIEYNPY